MKLSVLLITYNQEKYIAQALDSVLAQETDFDFEIVVGEDCSTDCTRDILFRYKKDYPEKLNIVTSDENVGGNRNIVRALKKCRGEYVATIDGDDYWTSTTKLQRQVDFLDSHPQCALCYSDVLSVWEDGSRDSQLALHKMHKNISTIVDLLAPECFLPNSSVMLRNGLVPSLDDWFFSSPMGDWPMHVLCARYGDIGYIPEAMAVYRRHSNSVLFRRDIEDFWRGEIKMLFAMMPLFDKKLRGRITARASHRYYLLAREYEDRGNIADACKIALQRIAIRYSDPLVESPMHHLLRLLLPARFALLQKHLREFTAGKRL